MYNPDKLKEAYDKMEHGKARLAAIRHAIAEADKNNDLPFRFYFRNEYCTESHFWGDSLDALVVFPQMLALADKYPDTPTTRYNSNIDLAVLGILWVYKWILGDCIDFYQIPLTDCLKYFEDFKNRCLEVGYNLRTYYFKMHRFYRYINKEKAEEYFHQFECIPRDGLADCKACERNQLIRYYLNKDNKKKADQLAVDIENFTLTCGSGQAWEHKRAWLSLKSHYMEYYLQKKDYVKAEAYCQLLERNSNGENAFECWEDFLCCYAHTNIGKALKIYKEHWKEWLKCRDPWDSFDINRKICIFLEELSKNRKGDTVKLPLDREFPLYKENGQYKIKELYDFYYDRAKGIAQKFDDRNQTSFYMDKLEGNEESF